MSLAEILNEALMDEIKARDTYRRIIDTYGPVRPFTNIVEAEQHHIDMVLPLFGRYGIAVPEVPDPARIAVPATLLELLFSILGGAVMGRFEEQQPERPH